MNVSLGRYDITSHHRMSGLSSTFTFHSSGTGKVKIKVEADLVPGESTLPVCRGPSHCLHMAERDL